MLCQRNTKRRLTSEVLSPLLKESKSSLACGRFPALLRRVFAASDEKTSISSSSRISSVWSYDAESALTRGCGGCVGTMYVSILSELSFTPPEVIRSLDAFSLCPNASLDTSSAPDGSRCESTCVCFKEGALGGYCSLSFSAAELVPCALVDRECKRASACSCADTACACACARRKLFLLSVSLLHECCWPCLKEAGGECECEEEGGDGDGDLPSFACGSLLPRRCCSVRMGVEEEAETRLIVLGLRLFAASFPSSSTLGLDARDAEERDKEARGVRAPCWGVSEIAGVEDGISSRRTL